MTPEQYIEVAEKVHQCHWRIDKEILERHGIESGVWVDAEDNPVLFNGEEIYNENELSQYILSWQGFGRTLEAMGKMECAFSRGFVFSADGIEIEFSRCIGQKGEEDGFEPTYQIGSHLYTDIVSIIQATHLAALEAVREGK